MCWLKKASVISIEQRAVSLKSPLSYSGLTMNLLRVLQQFQVLDCHYLWLFSSNHYFNICCLLMSHLSITMGFRELKHQVLSVKILAWLMKSFICYPKYIGGNSVPHQSVGRWLRSCQAPGHTVHQVQLSQHTHHTRWVKFPRWVWLVLNRFVSPKNHIRKEIWLEIDLTAVWTQTNLSESTSNKGHTPR